MAEVNNAAAEAARRAAIEAAKKAAAEAARKAAAKQAQEAAKKQAPKPKPAEPPKPEADKAEGFLGKLVDTAKNAAESLQAAAEKNHKRTVAETQKGLSDLKADMKQADSPKDVQKLAERAADLKAQADADSLMGEDMARDVARMANKLTKASEAMTELQSLKRGMGGSLDERAAATANVLANGVALQEKMTGLAALKGSPLADKAIQDLKDVAKEAQPENITRALENNPAIAHEIPGMAENLVKLRGLGDPALNAAIDQGAGALLDREGGLTLDQVKENPALGQLLAGVQDPALKTRVGETVKGWAKESLGRNLEDKEGEDGVKEAMEGFQNEMIDVAKQTGLVDAVQAGAEAATEEDQSKIEDVAKDGGGGVFGFVKDAWNAVSGVVEGAVNGLGAVIRKGVGAMGTLTDAALTGMGKINPLNIAAKGLDVVGLDGAAEFVGKGGQMLETAYDKVGDFTEDFSKGMGDALGGTLQGVGQMVLHPVATAKGLYKMATDPKALAAVGKALWAEGTKHGVGGALGYISGNALPMLLSGGATAGGLVAKGGSMAARGAALASKGGALATIGGKGLQIAAKGTTLAGEGLGKVSQVLAKPAAVTKALGDGKLSEAVRLLGKPSDEIASESARVATKTFRDSASAAKDGVRSLVGEAKDKGLREFAKDLNATRKQTKAEAKLTKKDAIDHAKQIDNKAEVAKRADIIRKALRSKGLSGERKANLIAKQLDHIHDAVKGTRTYRAIDGAVKTGAKLQKALTNPLTVLEDRLGGGSKFLRQDLQDKFKGQVKLPDGSVMMLTPLRQIASDNAKKALQESAKSSEYDQEKQQLNEKLRLAIFGITPEELDVEIAEKAS